MSDTTRGHMTLQNAGGDLLTMESVAKFDWLAIRPSDCHGWLVLGMLTQPSTWVSLKDEVQACEQDYGAELVVTVLSLSLVDVGNLADFAGW